MKKIILIIPCYNEEKNILNLYNKILDYNKKNKQKYDCIFINDGSSDRSQKILNDNKIPHIDLLFNLGIGGAVQTGYKYAYDNGYDVAVQFDGDGQHDIECVKDIVEPIFDSKVNMVIGSRFITKQDTFQSTKTRRLGIKLISQVIKFFTSKKIYDPTSGFRAVDNNIIPIFSKEYPIEYPEPVSTVMLLKMNYNIQEKSVIMHERKEGKSSIHTWKTIYYMINVFLSILITSMRRYNKDDFR